jgi:hypothetical protein
VYYRGGVGAVSELCFAEGLEDGVAFTCWGYDPDGGEGEVKKTAAQAYGVLSKSRLRRWRELIQLWWRRAEERVGRLEDVIGNGRWGQQPDALS